MKNTTKKHQCSCDVCGMPWEMHRVGTEQCPTLGNQWADTTFTQPTTKALKFAAILALLILLCCADTFAQRLQVIGVANGTADFKAGNLQQTVGLGVWSKYGGLVLLGKRFAEDAQVGTRKLPVWANATALAYYGRIALGENVLLTPYVAGGRRYSEAGINALFRINHDMMAGLNASRSARAGTMAGFTVFLQFSKHD